MDADATRQDRERQFHDALYAESATGGEGGREAAGRFYSIFEDTVDQFMGRVRERAAGRRVLEIGCGLTASAYELASTADSVLGIDISPVAVEQSRNRAVELGLHNVSFETMDAEHLDLDAASVDLVFATGVLHHLDIDRAGAELARVLTQDGSALFLEPMGHNPLINAYRNRTPGMRTPDEHPLVKNDFAVLGRYFTTVDTRFEHLSTLASVPFHSRASHHRMVRALRRVDNILFAAVPPLRFQAWYVALELAGPRPNVNR